MYRSLITLAVLALNISHTFAQNPVKGRVVIDSAGVQSGLKGIQIFVPASGEKTVTDDEGYFTFTPVGSGHMDIIARFSLNDSDVFMYHPPIVTFPLLVKNIEQIRAIEIRVRKANSMINSKGVQKIEILNEGEFKKAACCTLSESFETNNTIEVSNADGVSGIRQVEMLGLSGKYVLMTRDNIPVVRGLNILTGLDQIPGPMVGGVHIAKGAGSVTNGFEGITGGLNYALKSEPNEPKLFVNGYINSQARVEGNVIASQRLGKRSFNHAYLHYHNRYKVYDFGKDGFTDMPMGSMYYIGDIFKQYGKKAEAQLGASFIKGQRTGGDINEFRDPKTTLLRFRFNMEEERAEAFAKLGIFLNEDGSSSIGNILIVSQTKSNADLNNLLNRKYEGIQRNISYTGLWTTPDDNKWSFKSGVNLVYDDVDEIYTDRDSINGSKTETLNAGRTEFSAGVFSELVYKGTRANWVLGGRIDHNNLYGVILTPRFHYKYDVTKTQQLHFQAGMGRRTPWIFADNLPLFISNRKLVLNTAPQVPSNSGFAYGLPQEQAVNTGFSYTWHIQVFKLPSTISFDGFYTYFLNQNVADRDSDPLKLIIENQQGNSTTMAQIDWNLKPHRRVEVKLSYRYVNSQMVLGGTSRLQTMQAPHRGLVVVGYETRKKWFFDAVSQINSPKRLPSTAQFSELNRRNDFSPWYSMVNFQVRKDFKNWEFYSGCENILNVVQSNPVLNAFEPGTAYFDAAFAWGPTMGRNLYFGFRYKIK